jgi:glycosyltransferase involved in cell wall biosynthesis
MLSGKPKILFVGAFPPEGRKVFGGNVTACRALMNSSFPDMAELILIDSTQISNPPPSFPIRLLISIKRFFYFVIIFEKRKPDAILVFAAAGASMVEKCTMCWYAKIRGVTSLIFPRDGRILEYAHRPFLKWILPCLFSGASRVLCQGPAWKKFSMEILKRSDDETPVITNWTASDELLEIGANRKFETNVKELRFLFVGWLEDHKGVFELLEGVRTLTPSYDFTLDFVGSGHAVEEVRAFVNQHSLEETVTLHGWLDSDELLKMYAKSDIFVLPSWFEGLPNSLIEAMATKLAIIITKVGAIPDYLIDGQHGLLISPKNISELTMAMRELLENVDLRKELAENACELARNEWSADKAGNMILDSLKW